MTSKQGHVLCRCGHDRATHEHYRRGRDCGACGASSCGKFQAAAPDVAEVAAEVVAFPRRRLSLGHRHASLPSVTNDASVTPLPVATSSAQPADRPEHELSG